VLLLCAIAFMFGFVTALAGEIPKLDPKYQVSAERDGYIYANDGRTVLAVLRGKEGRTRASSRAARRSRSSSSRTRSCATTGRSAGR
jgi:hypothetical protein